MHVQIVPLELGSPAILVRCERLLTSEAGFDSQVALTTQYQRRQGDSCLGGFSLVMVSAMRRVVEDRKRVGYGGSRALIVPDEASGSLRRFTVYLVPSSPSRRVRVIGRELPIGLATRIAREGV